MPVTVKVIFTLFIIFIIIKQIVDCVKLHNKLKIIEALLYGIFFIMILISVDLGGFAYGNAKANFPDFDPNCYYLFMFNFHAVPKSIYTFLRIIQPIGLICFIVSGVISIINRKFKKVHAEKNKK